MSDDKKNNDEIPVQIIMENHMCCKILVNGQEMPGIRSIRLEASIEGLTTLHLEMIPSKIDVVIQHSPMVEIHPVSHRIYDRDRRMIEDTSTFQTKKWRTKEATNHDMDCPFCHGTGGITNDSGGITVCHCDTRDEQVAVVKPDMPPTHSNQSG